MGIHPAGMWKNLADLIPWIVCFNLHRDQPLGLYKAVVEKPHGEHHDRLNEADAGRLFPIFSLQQGGWFFKNKNKKPQTMQTLLFRNKYISAVRI